MRQLFLIFTFVITASTTTGNVYHLLTEKTGYCKPNRWYALGPCQQCFCVKKTKLICNTFNDGDDTDIHVGSQKLTLCLSNLKDDTDNLLNEVRGSKSLRASERISDDDSVEQEPEVKEKTPIKAIKPKEESAESDSSGQSYSKFRLPLSYPNVGDSPKNIQDSDSDDRADDEVSNESVPEARRYHLRQDPNTNSTKDQLHITVNLKNEQTTNNKMDLDLFLPPKILELIKINTNNRSVKMSRRTPVTVKTSQDYVVAYIHL